MRKVKFKKLIPAVYVYSDGTEGSERKYQNNEYPKRKDGTGIFEEGFDTEGVFHQWGVDSDGEGGTFSMAIVEDTAGGVHMVQLERLMFVNSSPLEKSQNDTYQKQLMELQKIRPDLVRFFYSAGQLKPWVALMSYEDKEGYYETNFETFKDFMELFN